MHIAAPGLLHTVTHTHTHLLILSITLSSFCWCGLKEGCYPEQWALSSATAETQVGRLAGETWHKLCWSSAGALLAYVCVWACVSPPPVTFKVERCHTGNAMRYGPLNVPSLSIYPFFFRFPFFHPNHSLSFLSKLFPCSLLHVHPSPLFVPPITL